MRAERQANVQALQSRAAALQSEIASITASQVDGARRSPPKRSGSAATTRCCASSTTSCSQDREELRLRGQVETERSAVKFEVVDPPTHAARAGGAQPAAAAVRRADRRARRGRRRGLRARPAQRAPSPPPAGSSATFDLPVIGTISHTLTEARAARCARARMKQFAAGAGRRWAGCSWCCWRRVRPARHGGLRGGHDRAEQDPAARRRRRRASRCSSAPRARSALGALQAGAGARRSWPSRPTAGRARRPAPTAAARARARAGRPPRRRPSRPSAAARRAGPAAAPAAAPRRQRDRVHRRPRSAIDRARLREQGLIVPERRGHRAARGIPHRQAADPARGARRAAPAAAPARAARAGLLAAAGRGQDLLRDQPRAGDRRPRRTAKCCWSTPTSPSPRSSRCSGLPGGPGLMDALADPDARGRGLRASRPTFPGLYVLPAGQPHRVGQRIPRQPRAPPRCSTG